MAVYCLRNKGAAIRYDQLAVELDALLPTRQERPTELLYQRLPQEAFKLPREALWSLVLFHRGRNRETGLYYCRRTLQTPDGKPFRIGETLRALERHGLLHRQGIVAWRVPQEDAATGRKNPPLRSSLLEPFFQNPTKERWIALRFVVYLAQAAPTRKGYRDIREDLGCSTELARVLAQYHATIHPRIPHHLIRNRVFNWTHERTAVQKVTMEQRTNAARSFSRGSKRLQGLRIAPNPGAAVKIKPAKTRESCTDSGPHYNSTNKEKENPSTRPSGRESGRGLSGSTSESGKEERPRRSVRFADLGFKSREEVPISEATDAREAVNPHAAVLGTELAYDIATGLFDLARRKKAFHGVGDTELAKYVVDVFLEMLRRAPTVNTSPLGYFFASLRKNLALRYCRLERKAAEVEKRSARDKDELHKQFRFHLGHVYSEVCRKVLIECRRAHLDFNRLSNMDPRKFDLMAEALVALGRRGEVSAFEEEVFSFSESYGSSAEAFDRFLLKHAAWVQSEYFNAMRHPRKAA